MLGVFFVFGGVFVLLGGVFVLFCLFVCFSRVSAIFLVFVVVGVARFFFRAKPSKAGNFRSEGVPEENIKAGTCAARWVA